MSTYILIMVIVVGTGNLSTPVSSSTVEFSSQAACEAAKENVRQKATSGRFILLTCEKK